MLNIERYTLERKDAWDEFVAASKNGTFLFFRDYMDYHNDRFDDHSLLVYDDRHHLVALLPAHRQDATLISHGGLTYGGFVTSHSMKLGLMLEVFDASLSYCHARGVRDVIYKTIPYIYHRVPAEEDRYALFVAQARWIRAGSLAVVPRARRLPYQQRRYRGITRAKAHGVTVTLSEDYEGFWVMLARHLEAAYGTRPVHTVHEIRLLTKRFPEHVKLFVCLQDETLVAGVVVYESAEVARAQYIASTDRGRTMGAVDLLLDHLLTEIYPAKSYFDLGVSEVDVRLVNRGLIDQKEGFGARAVGLDHYALDLTGWQPGTILKAITPAPPRF